MQPTILITIDVEDWFQVENFKPWIPFETWDQHELRVEKNTHRLLNLFDSVELKAPQLNRFHIQQGRQSSKLKADRGQSSKLKEANDLEDPKNLIRTDNEANHGDIEDFRHRRIELDHFHLESDPEKEKSQKSCKSCLIETGKNRIQTTFFILGWIAERLPNLIREIHSRGHEVASHGYNHNLANLQSHADLKQELTDSKKLLEDITASEVFGFRAPNFSISNDILKTIEDCGYLYDSSYNSFGLHGRYGQISLNGHSKQGIARKISENFFELPISNLILKGRTFPLGGGAYFRLLPFPLFQMGVSSILKKENAYLFYMHPWELDSEQPRVDNASYFNKFKHYTNISQTEMKLTNMMNKMSYCQFINCSEYLG